MLTFAAALFVPGYVGRAAGASTSLMLAYVLAVSLVWSVVELVAERRHPSPKVERPRLSRLHGAFLVTVLAVLTAWMVVLAITLDAEPMVRVFFATLAGLCVWTAGMIIREFRQRARGSRH